jgi:hypothetical protein
MLFSKQVQIAALFALAAVAGLVAARPAQAATAKSYAYIAWIETQSVMYQVNKTYDYEDDRWALAYEANTAAYNAFLELLDVENGVPGASLLQARNYLDDAANALFLLQEERGLPQSIRDKAESAQRYISYARNRVQRQLQD